MEKEKTKGCRNVSRYIYEVFEMTVKYLQTIKSRFYLITSKSLERIISII